MFSQINGFQSLLSRYITATQPKKILLQSCTNLVEIYFRQKLNWSFVFASLSFVSFPILAFLRRRSSRLCPSKTDRLLRLLWRPQKELSWHLSTSLRTIWTARRRFFFGCDAASTLEIAKRKIFHARINFICGITNMLTISLGPAIN